MAGQNTGSTDTRRDQIATAAYYRAERRGFQGDGQLDDWLAAEREIDSMSSARGVKGEASQREAPLDEPGLATGGDVLRTDLEAEHIRPDEVHQWADRLKVSPALLREVIKRAGHRLQDVKNELASIHPAEPPKKNASSGRASGSAAS